MGIGHSAPITRVKISPDEDYILSASKDGAILRWKFPLNWFKWDPIKLHAIGFFPELYNACRSDVCEMLKWYFIGYHNLSLKV